MKTGLLFEFESASALRGWSETQTVLKSDGEFRLEWVHSDATRPRAAPVSTPADYGKWIAQRAMSNRRGAVVLPPAIGAGYEVFLLGIDPPPPPARRTGVVDGITLKVRFGSFWKGPPAYDFSSWSPAREWRHDGWVAARSPWCDLHDWIETTQSQLRILGGIEG